MGCFPFFCTVKILILHQHFNTPARGGPLRSYYLATALAQRGHRVVVITGGKTRQTEHLENIRMETLAVAYDNRFAFLARMASFVKYAWRSYRLARHERAVDYVYAISVPLTVGWTAIRLKKKRGWPFLFEVGDLWPEAPIQLGFLKNPWLQAKARQLEQTIYKEAEAIVALSPMIRAAIEKAVPHKKIHLIPNMADTDFFRPLPKQAAWEKEWHTEGKFVISYIGALGYANGLHAMLDAAHACAHQRDWLFALAGDGAMLSDLQTRAAREHLANVRFIPFGTREAMQKLMNVTDVCLISYLPVPVLQTGSPNKYFDALAAGKPVVVNFGGWIREEVERVRCGLYAEANQPHQYEAAILKIKEDYPAYATAARALAERSYSRQALSQRFAEVFDEAANSR